MADGSILNTIASATGTSPSPNSGVTIKTTSDTATLASNFTTFLTLLTTQLKNQNPLDPLDTNQFTQQLVQFAGVEQQMKMNSQMTSLISIEQSAQSTAAMAYLGSTATVDGSTTKLAAAKPRGPSRPTSRRREASALRIRPAILPIRGPLRSMPDSRTSPGTARAITAQSGRTAITR